MMESSSQQSTCASYQAAIFEQVPRVLSLMDREPFSLTEGCCDRTYWAWKFVDFPGARFQEAMCVLGFLYSVKLDGSPYYQSRRLLQWISNGLRFWSAIQHRDGSFDEAYPLERSLAATAFTSFYVGESLEFLGDQLPDEIRVLIRQTMARAGRWLINNDETHGFLSNHLAAAASALYHIYRVTGDDAFENRSRYFIQRIMNHQSEEGWYEEYGGADPGYQTHGSFYLARYWQLSHNAEVAASLARANSFLAHFVHPDGSLGGEYASRNTKTYYPAAYEMMAPYDPAAAWVADTMRLSVASGAAAGLRCVDAYNFFPFLNNLVFAFLATADQNSRAVRPMEPSSEDALVSFPRAGIARVRRARYDAYVGTVKGGVIQVFDHETRKLIYSDCGYIGHLQGDKVVSTQHHDCSRVVSVSPNRVNVNGKFAIVPTQTMTPYRFIGFRMFSLVLGRFPACARWLKRVLVRSLIYNTKEINVGFERTMEFDDSGVTVCDKLCGPDGNKIKRLEWGATFSTIHMGSSRYFIPSELNLDGSTDHSMPVDCTRIVDGITVRRHIRLGENVDVDHIDETVQTEMTSAGSEQVDRASSSRT